MYVIDSGTSEYVGKKVGRSEAGAPKLASLPPTNEAFNENVARAQTGSKQPVWKLFNMVTMTTLPLLFNLC